MKFVQQRPKPAASSGQFIVNFYRDAGDRPALDETLRLQSSQRLGQYLVRDIADAFMQQIATQRTFSERVQHLQGPTAGDLIR